MTKSRLEAFSDGVIAIIITIMVLELKVPHGDSLEALRPLIPVFFGYVLSFVFVAIYWNNHHHLFQVVHHVDGRVLWANSHLLFWLSLVPFTTGWMDQNHFSGPPVAIYGVNLLMAGFAYSLLVRALLARHAEDSPLATAVGSDMKGKISLALYLAAIGICFIEPRVACAIYVAVAILWIVPDRRVSRVLGNALNSDA